MLGPLTWRVRIFSRLIQKFGMLTAFRLFCDLYTRVWVKRGTIKTIHLSSYPKPISVRLRTSDVSSFPQVFMEEAFDLAFLNLNPKVIIDAGANAGFASIYFAHAYPRARVFAIEPEESNFQMLLRNAEFYPNILPIRAALWSEEGELQITNPNADKWSFQVNKLTKDKAAETIDAITMDKLLSMAKTDKIDIIKIDIEGAEAELFCANYENWLKKINVIIIELHETLKKGCTETFYRAVNRYDFHKWERKEHTILSRRS